MIKAFRKLPIKLEQLQAFQSKRAVVAVIKINDKETRARINTAIKRKGRTAEEKAEKEAEEEKREKKGKPRKITGKRRPPKRRMTGKKTKRTKSKRKEETIVIQIQTQMKSTLRGDGMTKMMIAGEIGTAKEDKDEDNGDVI